MSARPGEGSTRWRNHEEKQHQPLADDRKTKFTRHQEVVDGQRRDTSQHDARVKHLDEDNARWTHRSDAPRTPGGVAAGTELATLKAASDTDRAARGQGSATAPARVISASALTACVASWCQNTAEGRSFHIGNSEIDDFNDESLNRAIQHHLKSGWNVSVELIAEAYSWALRNNYVDTRRRDPDGSIVSIRGGQHLAPATICPPCIWPDEQQQIAQEETQNAIAARLAEDATNKAKSFDQLQREVRKNFNPTAAGITNVGERIR